MEKPSDTSAAGEDSRNQPEAASGQSPDENQRSAEVIRDEQEAMRREKLPHPDEEAPEAENPQIAEIESTMAAFRH